MDVKRNMAFPVVPSGEAPKVEDSGKPQPYAPAPSNSVRVSQYRVLWLVVLVALGLRIGWMITEPKVIENEGAEYVRIASNLRSGHGYVGTMAGPQLLFPPFYPVLIAGVSFVTGNVELAARLINLLAGTLLVLSVFLIADTVYGRRVAVISALLIAFYPLLIALSASTYSECLYITLIASGLYHGLRWQESKRTRHAVLAGVFLSLAYLTRPEAVPYPLVLTALLIVTNVIEGKGLHARASEWRWGLIFVARSTLLAAICMTATHVALPKTLTYPVGFAILIVVTILLERENWNPIVLQSAWMLMVCALLATPYIAYLWLHTGELRLQGKSEVNYLIGARLNAGLDANQATWGLGPGARPEGPLLDPNRYLGSVPYPRDLPGMLHYLVRSARRNQWELRHMEVFPWLFWPLLLMALAASLPDSWGRERLSRETLLISFFILACLPLVIAPVFSVRRLLLPVVPIALLWSSKGIEELLTHTETTGSKFLLSKTTLRTTAWLVALGSGVLLLYCGERALTHFPDLHGTKRDLVRKEAGLYLESHPPGPKRIMDSGTLVSYYSGGTWMPMPWASGGSILNYITRQKPDFVAVDLDDWNPGAMDLKNLLEQEPRAHFVREFGSGATDRLRIYEWSHE